MIRNVRVFDVLQVFILRLCFIAMQYWRRIEHLVMHTLNLWRSMHKRSLANIFRRTSVAGMYAQAWKRSLVALLAVVMAFGADLPAFSSPAMAGCNGFQQAEVGTQVPRQAANKSVPDMPCKCPMHDCVVVSCCGLAAGLMPSDALMTPAHKWADTEQTPELSRTSVSLPPALPPPIDHG